MHLCTQHTNTSNYITMIGPHTCILTYTHTHQQQLIANIHMYHTQYFIHTHTQKLIPTSLYREGLFAENK